MKPEIVHSVVPDSEEYPAHMRGKSTEDLLHTGLISKIRWHRHPVFRLVRILDIPITVLAILLTPFLWLFAVILCLFIREKGEQ